jgi:hypothetical protein
MEHVTASPRNATAENGGRTVRGCLRTQFTGCSSVKEMCVKQSCPHSVQTRLSLLPPHHSWRHVRATVLTRAHYWPLA